MSAAERPSRCSARISTGIGPCGDGQLISGAAAFARLWRTLPGWRWLGRVVDLRVLGARPVLPLAELAYRLSLPLRPRLARLIARLR